MVFLNKIFLQLQAFFVKRLGLNFELEKLWRQRVEKDRKTEQLQSAGKLPLPYFLFKRENSHKNVRKYYLLTFLMTRTFFNDE